MNEEKIYYYFKLPGALIARMCGCAGRSGNGRSHSTAGSVSQAPVHHRADAREVKSTRRGFEVKAPRRRAQCDGRFSIDDLGFGATEYLRRAACRHRRSTACRNGGLRYNSFHTTALCSPTRAALKSGRNHHTGNMGFITEMATGSSRRHRRDPESRGPAGRDAPTQRLQHRRLRQVA